MAETKKIMGEKYIVTAVYQYKLHCCQFVPRCRKENYPLTQNTSLTLSLSTRWNKTGMLLCLLI